jgi:uncharacterized protein (TIGR02246 family)
VRSIALAIMLVTSLSRADAEAVRATLHRYVTAWLAGDPDAVMSELSPDAVFIPTDKAPYVGARAIRNYWWPANAPRFALARFDTTVDDVTGSGDFAVCRGTQILEWTSDGERWRTRGNYVTVLRKTDSGWRISLQMAANAKNERVSN